MKADIIQINPEHPQPRKISLAVRALEKGEIIAFPTDSTYGIGCNLYDKNAVDILYRLRNRSKKKPFTFLCRDLSNLSQYAYVQNYAYKLMRRLTPGPYTFILEATPLVPRLMRTKRLTVGIRVPDHPVCLELLRELGRPIISTTARSNSTFFSDPKEIKEAFGDRLRLVIDAGYIFPEPTTVLDLVGDEPKLIRIGKGEWIDE